MQSRLLGMRPPTSKQDAVFFLEKKGTHGGGLLPRKGLWSVHVVLDTHGHLRVLMIRHGVLVVLVVLVMVVMMMVRRNCPSM